MDSASLQAGAGDVGTALSEAFSACVGSGGIVIVPPGRWSTGPQDIPSDTTLRLEKNSILQFHSSPELYTPEPTRWEGVECHGFRPLLRARDAVNVAVEGAGTIDGNGAAWWSLYRKIRNGSLNPSDIPGVKEILGLNADVPGGSGGGGRETGFLRPPLVQFINCRNLRLDGVSFRNSPFWNTHILYSSEVLIRSCSFTNPADAPNTDGLNIDSSSEVCIEGCIFDVGDDCLCLKSGSDTDGRRVGQPTERVVVRDCEMNKGHGAIVMGSEISGGIRDITVERCRFTGTDRGIRVKSRRGRGGFVKNLIAREIEMSDVPFPLVINLYYRCGAEPADVPAASSVESQPAGPGTPEIRNIRIQNLKASGVKVGVFTSGLPESPVSDMKLADWDLSFAGEDQYEPAMDFQYTRIPATGLYGRHFRNIHVHNFQIGRSEVRAFDVDIETELVMTR